ncbi:MAG: hypothetical protein HY985_06280 [Magnetospirillum sp.]|nr:hypothetical protein [Magnetospirillum sp.]
MLRLLKIAAVNLGLLLAAALAAELVFGTWFSSDPLDGLVVPRDTAVTVSAKGLYPGGGEFSYRRDHWGFRGTATDPARVDIVTIGGSTTNQLYLPEAQTWQAATQRALGEHGKTVTIANAGIDGQSTVGHLKNLELWLPAVPGLKPHFVLAYVGINDTHITGPAVDLLEHSSWSKVAKQKSALLRLAATVQGTLKARKAKLNHQAVDFATATWTGQPNYPDPATLPTLTFPDRYKARLIRMAELIHQMGAVPVFVTQVRGDARRHGDGWEGLAAAAGLNGLDHQRLLARFNAATLEVCAEQGIVCLDLAGEVEFSDGDFYDHVHNTPQGAEKVGRWLAAKLAGLV